MQAHGSIRSISLIWKSKNPFHFCAQRSVYTSAWDSENSSAITTAKVCEATREKNNTRKNWSRVGECFAQRLADHVPNCAPAVNAGNKCDARAMCRLTVRPIANGKNYSSRPCVCHVCVSLQRHQHLKESEKWVLAIRTITIIDALRIHISHALPRAHSYPSKYCEHYCLAFRGRNPTERTERATWPSGPCTLAMDVHEFYE